MMEYINEVDFLNPFRAESGLWYFRYEEMLFNAVSAESEIGLCQNSSPVYCRCGKTGNGSLLHDQSFQHDNVSLYDEQCSKCGWGIYAHLSAHAMMHGSSIRFYDGGRGVLVRSIYQGYHKQCKSAYESLHGNDYEYYRDIQDYASLAKLDDDFTREHLVSEKSNIIRTEELGAGSVDNLFFGGGLKGLANGYLEWVENREDEANIVLPTKAIITEREFDIARDYVDTGIYKRIFNSDKEKFAAFLKEVRKCCAVVDVDRLVEDGQYKGLFKGGYHGWKTELWKDIVCHECQCFNEGQSRAFCNALSFS